MRQILVPAFLSITLITLGAGPGETVTTERLHRTGAETGERSLRPIATPPSARADTTPAEVMILGVWHFAGGTNVIEAKPGRIMKPRRQRELQTAMDSLAAFRPTKVAIERLSSDQPVVDSLYRTYRAGRHKLDASEDQQVGFRMANRMDLKRVYAIDHKIPWPIDTLTAYAKEHAPWFLKYQKQYRNRVLATMDSLRKHATVSGIFRWFNSPETEDFLHEPYMRMPEVGISNGFVGVKPVANYYRRNLRIFANLTRVVEPGDRVLVVYGSGHLPFLQEFVRAHPGMELVSPLDYLGGV